MKIIHNFYEPEINSSPSVIALGTFDGLHLGHCDVIREAHVYAKQHNLKLLVFTFSNHPLSEIRPDDVPAKLITNEEKESIFENLGVDILVNIPFTHYFSQLSPTDFLQKLKVFSYKCLVVGENYNYGFKGEGNTKTLIEAGKTDGFDVVVRNLVTIDEIVVSSSNIRKLIQAGEVATANRMLGREYSIKGRVVPGANRGNCLGFPTANLELTDIELVIPAKGVYAARVSIDSCEYIGMVNIGYSPTFGDVGKKRLEINIFDFVSDIYGKEILVKLVSFIRGERKFASPDELCLQLQRDKETVLSYFQP